MTSKGNKNLIQLHVSQLKLGMFVSELDKSWLETPFVVQGIRLESQRDIDAICEHASFVWIDPLKQTTFVGGSLKTIKSRVTSEASRSKRNAAVARKSEKKRKEYPKLNTATEEHKVARFLYIQGKSAIKKILRRVSDRNEVALDEAQALVNSCMESVIRNPDALMWMSKIREQDEYTAEHCLNVCILAMVFGRHLGLTEVEIVRLGLCGLLHDVGKMRMPVEILNKPSKLSIEEFDIIKQHTVAGYTLLKESSNSIPPIVSEVARSHHEKMDGTGYPKGVPAGNLNELVRIISIVDAYDAITSDRCYSKGKSNTEALKVIYEQKGIQFDEELALAFIRCIGIYPAGTIVQLINGMAGVVIEINRQYRHLPTVLILRDADGSKINPYVLNLLEVEFGNLSSENLVRCTLKTGSLGIELSTEVLLSSQ